MKRIIKNSVCLGILVLVSTAGQAQPFNLVQNGGFDTGADFWFVEQGQGWDGGTGNPPGSFILNSGGDCYTDPTITQVVEGLAPGGMYQISGDYTSYVPSCGNPAALAFGVSVDGQWVLELARPEGWGHFSVDFTAPASSITLALAAERNCDDSSYYVDNIAVTAVPEPLQFSLFSAAGLGLLGLVRTRLRHLSRQ